MSTNEPTVATEKSETQKCVATHNFFGHPIMGRYEHRERDHEGRRHLSCTSSEASRRQCTGHDPIYAEPSAPAPSVYEQEIAIDEALDLGPAPSETPAPIPMILTCPSCGARHIDVGEFATKVHHTHACQSCGTCWRPAIVPTVGVQFLPGFKNEPRETPAREWSEDDEAIAMVFGHPDRVRLLERIYMTKPVVWRVAYDINGGGECSVSESDLQPIPLAPYQAGSDILPVGYVECPDCDVARIAHREGTPHCAKCGWPPSDCDGHPPVAQPEPAAPDPDAYLYREATGASEPIGSDAVNTPEPLVCTHCGRQIERPHQHEIKGQDGYEGFYCRPEPFGQCCSWHGPRCVKDSVYCCDRCPSVPAPVVERASDGCRNHYADGSQIHPETACCAQFAESESAFMAWWNASASKPTPQTRHAARTTWHARDAEIATLNLHYSMLESQNFDLTHQAEALKAVNSELQERLDLHMGAHEARLEHMEKAERGLDEARSEIERLKWWSLPGTRQGWQTMTEQLAARDLKLREIAKVAEEIREVEQGARPAPMEVLRLADRILVLTGESKP